MKITICSSAFFTKECYDIKKELEKNNHLVFIWSPEIGVNGNTVSMKDFHAMRKNNLTEDLLKLKKSLIDEHIERIKDSDAVLVLNFDKNGIKNYIGGNTFLEMGFAYVLGKKIFLLNPIPGINYKEEIEAMSPLILCGDLNKIKEN
ncbi:hypothetical protein KAT95_00790 [Candidatus Parcubacteria bacterium]|nr:hypothetical protein [Candidatus Parcubacteria bacterium]